MFSDRGPFQDAITCFNMFHYNNHILCNALHSEITLIFVVLLNISFVVLALCVGGSPDHVPH